MLNEEQFLGNLEEITSDLRIENMSVEQDDIDTLKDYASGDLTLESILDSHKEETDGEVDEEGVKAEFESFEE